MTHALDFATWRGLPPSGSVERALAAMAAGDAATWIRPLSRAELQPFLDRLETPETQPLHGLPFAIKDNIDLAGIPTTAGCPDYAYVPDRSAFVVERLVAAGAIPLGKTNLDQFATGLVGTRSPYGVPRNPRAPDHIPGGSSSGSAVAVASGQAAFALGTDTAGSGRVPAAFNGLVGIKPTRGLLGLSGVVPACRSLDCMSIFAGTIADARQVLEVAIAPDPRDPWRRPFTPPPHPFPERPVIGVPQSDQLQFFGHPHYEQCFYAACRELRQHAEVVEIDAFPFFETARLLYGGPWVAERTAVIDPFLTTHPDSLHPVTATIIEGGRRYSAVDTFRAMYELEELRREVEATWACVDILLTPTTGTHYTLAEVAADPVETNSNLGTYTNFMNLLDLAALALPAGSTPDGLPFGVTLCAPAFRDFDLLELAANWHREPLPPPPRDTVRLAVCGAHLSGFPLNHQLTERGAHRIGATLTASDYRLYVLPGTTPAKPGLVRDPGRGAAIAVELWEVPTAGFGSFVAQIPPPLGIGNLQLEDGSWVKGFACDPSALGDAEEITRLGDWRRYPGHSH